MRKMVRNFLLFYIIMFVGIFIIASVISLFQKEEKEELEIKDIMEVNTKLKKKRIPKVVKKKKEEKKRIERELKQLKKEESRGEVYEITAYTAGPESTGKSPGHPQYGVTASGEKVRENYTIAADWNILPEGTKVEIEGMGVYVVKDKGGDIKGNRIDIYMEDLDKALKFGRQNLKVKIIGGE